MSRAVVGAARADQGSSGRVPADRVLVERVRARLAEAGAEPSGLALAAAVRAESGVLGETAVRAAVSALRGELAGAGALEPLLAVPGVTDVLVNGPADVWIDTGAGLERAAVRFADEAAVRRLAVRLAGSAGRRLDDASPCVDARLAGGVRLHAAVPPVSPCGTVISLRVASAQQFTLPDLVAAASLDDLTAAVLTDLVAARVTCLVTGGTGCGKTTLLTTLLGLVADQERIVLVEESGELRPDHPHVVRLEARPPNAEGAGEVTVRDLVREALRMRPDRLVVGEVRGPEIVDLLTALNTGHEGGFGTMHANTAHDVPARVEALGALAGLARPAMHSLLAAAVRVVVHMERRGSARVVASVSVLERGPDGDLVVLPGVQEGQPGPAAERLARLLRRSR